MAENKQWKWEIKGYIRGTPDEIMAKQQRFADFCNINHKSSSTLIGEMFWKEFEEAENDPEYLLKLKGSNLGVSKRVAEIKKDEATVIQLRKVFESDYANDIEGFTNWCIENNVPNDLIDKTLNEYLMEIPAWSKRANDWLRDEILASGLPRATEEIHKLAIEAGIISESGQDWNRMRQLAWRERYSTGEKGKWQWERCPMS